MWFEGLPRVLVRRWYATLFGLALTVALALGALTAVHPTYQANGDVLLLPPKKEGDNPYLNLGTLNGVADVLATDMSSPAVVTALQTAGAAGSYTVAPDPSSNAPVLLVTTSANSPADAISTMRAVIDQMAPRLLGLQEDLHVPTASLISSRVIAEDVGATALHKSQSRAALVAGAIGLVLTLLLAVAVESLFARRARRKTHAKVPAGDAPKPDQLPPARRPRPAKVADSILPERAPESVLSPAIPAPRRPRPTKVADPILPERAPEGVLAPTRAPGRRRGTGRTVVKESIRLASGARDNSTGPLDVIRDAMQDDHAEATRDSLAEDNGAWPNPSNDHRE